LVAETAAAFHAAIIQSQVIIMKVAAPPRGILPSSNMMSACETAVQPVQVSVDFAWSPNGIDGRWFDWLGLVSAADWAFVMGYDTQSQVHAVSNTACMGSSSADIPCLIRHAVLTCKP